MSFWSELAYVQDSFRKMMKEQKEAERISPKEYGMMLQRKKRRRKKRGGRE